MEDFAATQSDDNINPENIPSVGDSQNSARDNSRYRQQSHQLLTIFPSVVWDRICSFLDSEDFLNIINTSLSLRELFLPKRVLCLYKPVLEILLPQLKAGQEFHSTIRRRDHTVNSVLVNCRAVCKSWKWTIDRKACIWLPQDNSEENNLVHHVLSERYRHRSMLFDEFLQHFNTSHPASVNPFPGRYIQLDLQPEIPEFPEFPQNGSIEISNLLRKYGRHIWTCEIKLLFGALNPPEFHEKMVDWLTFMPNLKNLNFFCLFEVGPNNNPSNPELVPPKLKFLRKLKLNAISSAFFEDEFPDWSWMERCNLSNLVTVHDNLDFLQLTMFNKSDAQILESFNSPLKTLVANYHFDEDQISVTQVFSMLSEKFSDTLENLNVRFHVNDEPSGHVKFIRDSFDGRLDLPKVKKFEINLAGLFSLDFLMGMENSLEELIIVCKGTDWYGYTDFSVAEQEEIRLIESEQIIKFLGYQQKMMESNIWKRLPKLEKILVKSVGRNVEYTRENGMKVEPLRRF